MRGLWQSFRGFRGVGTRDWAARESLRGERGCASEPVAREGGMMCRSEVSTGLTFGVFEHFAFWATDFENYLQGSFLVLVVHIVHKKSKTRG